MTDQEMDIIDELHFVQPFTYLLENVGLAEQPLKETLRLMAGKGWIKILRTVDEEIPVQEADLQRNGHAFYYLATKKGLLAFHTTGG